MKRVMVLAPALFLALAAHAALPGDSADGKRLHDANCGGCHDATVYTRQNHSIRSLDALKQQLEGCGHVAKKEFSATETQNLVKYLNDRFYHFQ
jgi:cytochrome c553